MGEQPDHPLVSDLHRVLKYEVKLSGAFAISKVIPGCPNPGLDVDGVGRIPLPLTNQTAELIESVGHQAPYGHGADTVVDTTVRDTIQIDASKIRFVNPKWAPTIQEWTEKEVWNGLGCAPFTSPPRCELYKLLLYKPGAHFLPHKDTEKAPGMFATLVITLPSEFMGGEIHVSHGDQSMVFDNSKDSAFETTSLAWYTDVTHEVKEITSGYRLALSYYLINTSPGVGPPHIPSDDSGLQHFREILSKWSNGGYPSLKVNPVVAYVFAHEYSTASLREAIFKGADQRIVSIFKHLGDTEGVIALMGWLNARVQGSTASEGWQIFGGYYTSAPEYGYDKGDYHSPVMSHVHETKIWVEDLRNMQGKGIGLAKIKVHRDSLLPYKPFRNVGPDESEMGEGYWGNEGASVEFMYKCAALVVFPKDKQVSLMLASGGSEWGLEELEKSKSEGPSKENREIIDFLAQLRDKEIMPTILQVAIEWKDVAVWDGIVLSYPEFLLKQEEYADLCVGWQTFTLDGVRSTFEKLFRPYDEYKPSGMRFLLFVKGKLPVGKDPEKDEWISAQATSAMGDFTPHWINDTTQTEVMDMIRWKGLRFASSVVLPRFLTKRADFRDRTGFAAGLVKHKAELIALPGIEGQTTSNAELFDGILDKILKVTIAKLSQVGIGDSLDTKVPPLFSICIRGNRMKSYGDLLDSLFPSAGKEPFYARYRGLYSKIIPKLVKQLGEHGIKVWSSPSREFFNKVIGRYLEEILGSKEGSPYLKFAMLTCGHEACIQVNDFLGSEETSRVIEAEWPGTISDCVGGLKIDGRYALFEADYRWKQRPVKLTKKDETQAAQHWSVRLGEARKLLEGIGTDEEISQIMGERYSDVEKALEGSQAFVISGTRSELEKEDGMVGIE